MVNSPAPPADARARLLVAFQAGQVIVQEGTKGREMYIIEDGTVEIVKLYGPTEKVLSQLGPGDFFGEMSLLEDRPRMASARAGTDCKLLPIDASTFDQLLRENPEITIRMMRRLSQRLRRYEEDEARAGELAQGVLGGVSRADLPRLVPVAMTSEAPAAAVPGAPTARLVHAETGRAYLLFPGNDASVGRFDPVTEMAPDVDLSEIDTQRSTSRRHARVAERGGRFYVREEIGTANGTFVGEDRLSTGVERELSDGDPIRFGRVDVVFRAGA